MLCECHREDKRGPSRSETFQAVAVRASIETESVLDIYIMDSVLAAAGVPNYHGHTGNTGKVGLPWGGDFRPKAEKFGIFKG